jgi:hypothetical protein
MKIINFYIFNTFDSDISIFLIVDINELTRNYDVTVSAFLQIAYMLVLFHFNDNSNDVLYNNFIMNEI